MSNKGSSASFVCIKKSAIISRLSLVTVTLFVIFSLISCEGGVYNETITEEFYSKDSLHINHELMGHLTRLDTSKDFSNIDSVIIKFDHITTRDCYLEYMEFTSGPFDSIIVFRAMLNKCNQYISHQDTIPVLRKCVSFYNQISFEWFVNDSLVTGNYTVLKNIKLYKYNVY